jgi:hypothetical protein
MKEDVVSIITVKEYLEIIEILKEALQYIETLEFEIDNKNES